MGRICTEFTQAFRYGAQAILMCARLSATALSMESRHRQRSGSTRLFRCSEKVWETAHHCLEQVEVAAKRFVDRRRATEPQFWSGDLVRLATKKHQKRVQLPEAIPQVRLAFEKSASGKPSGLWDGSPLSLLAGTHVLS